MLNRKTERNPLTVSSYFLFQFYEHTSVCWIWTCTVSHMMTAVLKRIRVYLSSRTAAFWGGWGCSGWRVSRRDATPCVRRPSTVWAEVTWCPLSLTFGNGTLSNHIFVRVLGVSKSFIYIYIYNFIYFTFNDLTHMYLRDFIELRHM